MKSTALRTIATLALATYFAAAIPAHAEIRSQSKELIVMEPSDLPEAAQVPGNSFFLHADSIGNTYLYIEQQQGERLIILDVSDPAKIKLVSSTPLTGPGAFDFVRPLDGAGELIRFRDGKGVAVLDLHKAKQPSLHMVPALADPGQTVALGETGFLGVDEPYNYIRAVPVDFQVVDISTPSNPALLTTVKQVKHHLTKDNTGTTFLLGSGGLTVVRRVSVENGYKLQQTEEDRN